MGSYSKGEEAMSSVLKGIDLEILRNAVDYDSETGIFRWSKPRCKVQVGGVLGYKRKDGYIHIKFNGVSILGHVLAWFYVHGRVPSGEVDHLNHDRGDNRISNLRDVPAEENAKNRKRYANNRTGHAGVFLRKDSGKYIANINVLGKLKHLGTFKCISEAIAARRWAEEAYGYHDNHGDKS